MNLLYFGVWQILMPWFIGMKKNKVKRGVHVYAINKWEEFSPPRLQGYTFRKSTIFGSFESKHLEKSPTKCKYTPIGYIVHK
jgi:hypothetical protein